MPTLTIDGVEITVEPGSTVMQACVEAGKEIPHFCYHDRLSIAGNCRMCLVEMEKSPKPIASCAMPAGDGMVIHTDTPKVKKAREGVMEFLLINHPLDCPICDQGGECDLQDQAMAYGRHFSRFDEGKRAVRDKDVGPLIETIMTRCIHCTRCIRFADEIAGVEEFGAVFRGEHMEIGTYVEKAVSSELSGNMIDLCPVGALTSKPYAFVARSWELRSAETIDVFDAVGANIRVDARGPEVLRVVPRLHEDVNEEWITDKSRFAYDGLRRRRIDRCYVRRDGKLEAASWDEAVDAIAAAAKGLDGSAIGALAGDLIDCEAMTALRDLMTALGSPNIDCRQDGAKLDPKNRAGYLFNTTIAGIEESDAILLIGTNPRREAALVNARIRKRWRRGGLKVGVIGPQVDLTYPHDYIGAGPQSLTELSEGRHSFADVLRAAEKPMVIVGMGALARPDGAAVLAAARALADKTGMAAGEWDGFNVLHTAAARVGGLDLGFVPGAGGRDTEEICKAARSGEIRLLYLLGADELGLNRPDNCFVVYQGHHGDAGAHIADVVLPGAAYSEKSGTYVNLEGRAQRAYPATAPLGDAREDWRIIRALSGHLGKALPYDTLDDLRAHMVERTPTLGAIDQIEPASWRVSEGDGSLTDRPFVSPIANFYQTDPITRASETMDACSARFGSQSGTGTDG
jgi:NADH-quinone oxidoreductase subunit G